LVGTCSIFVFFLCVTALAASEHQETHQCRIVGGVRPNRRNQGVRSKGLAPHRHIRFSWNIDQSFGQKGRHVFVQEIRQFREKRCIIRIPRFYHESICGESTIPVGGDRISGFRHPMQHNNIQIGYDLQCDRTPTVVDLSELFMPCEFHDDERYNIS
jgi:hypothetical protein